MRQVRLHGILGLNNYHSHWWAYGYLLMVAGEVAFLGHVKLFRSRRSYIEEKECLASDFSTLVKNNLLNS